MQDLNSLYNTYIHGKDQRKRDNVIAIVNKAIAIIEKDLDKLYCGDKAEYKATIENVKARGLRVFRNDAGKHKVIVSETVTESPLP